MKTDIATVLYPPGEGLGAQKKGGGHGEQQEGGREGNGSRIPGSQHGIWGLDTSQDRWVGWMSQFQLWGVALF